MRFQTYQFFDGRCEEAIHFHKSVLGTDQITLLHMKDNPDAPQQGAGR